MKEFYQVWFSAETKEDAQKILKELNVDYDLGDYRNIAENALSDFVSKVDKDNINVKDISNVYDEDKTFLWQREGVAVREHMSFSS